MRSVILSLKIRRLDGLYAAYAWWQTKRWSWTPLSWRQLGGGIGPAQQICRLSALDRPHTYERWSKQPQLATNRRKLDNCGSLMSRPLKAWSLGSTIASRGSACRHCLRHLSLFAMNRIPYRHARRFASRPVSSPKQSSLPLGPDLLNLDKIKKTVRKYLGSEKDYATILRLQPTNGKSSSCIRFVSNSPFL